MVGVWRACRQMMWMGMSCGVGVVVTRPRPVLETCRVGVLVTWVTWVGAIVVA